VKILYLTDGTNDMNIVLMDDNSKINFNKVDVGLIKDKNFDFEGYDCVVVNSPLEGTDCVGIVRELRGRHGKPIIVYGSCAGIGELFAAGADDYIDAESDPHHELLINKIATLVTMSHGDELHRLIFENTPDFLVIIDEKGFVLEISKALPLGFGYKHDEINSSNITKFVIEKAS
jgi:hypothetical protein